MLFWIITGKDDMASDRRADRDNYAILGVLPGASAEQINAAYRRLVKEVHPDRDGSDGARFREVTEAKDALLADLRGWGGSTRSVERALLNGPASSVQNRADPLLFLGGVAALFALGSLAVRPRHRRR